MELRVRIPASRQALVWLSLCAFLLTACSNNPGQLKEWYAENYPSKPTAIEDKQSPSRKKPSADSKTGRTEPRSSVEKVDAPLKNHRIWSPFSENEETETTTGSLKLVKRSLEDPVDLKYAATKPKLSEYNVSSMIEGKLLKMVDDAYERRDENEFTRLYQFFLDSFPQSARRAYLEERWRTFFYSENLNSAPLKGGLVDVTYPSARDLDELSRYFAKLKSNGVKSVQLQIVQQTDQPVYLFANQQNPVGYYFKTPNGPLVDDLLDRITALAHANGLMVLVSLPLRHHPMLGHQSVMIVDESWNSIQNRTTPNDKLDLLNPAGRQYLREIIDSLLASQVDGIVFKDDFTYEIHEGFSAAALKAYLQATGRSIVFNQLFVPVSEEPNRYAILADEDFDRIALWRTREIKQLLWDLISEIRSDNPSFLLGMEVTPEMLLQEELAVRYYATGPGYLRDLDLDLFILKWRKTGSNAESDVSSYARSVKMLREEALRKTRIYTKVPLSQETQNIIQLNRRISENARIQQDLDNVGMAIGPVTRLQKLDFLHDASARAE